VVDVARPANPIGFEAVEDGDALAFGSVLLNEKVEDVDSTTFLF
jgi:hypothetical protein